MTTCILVIDEGTTSTRAMVFAINQAKPNIDVMAISQYEFTQYYPKDGWVEHDPIEIWQKTQRACQDVIQQVGIENITALGITNQRETTVIWNKQTGEPIYPAIVWQDRRTSERCRQLADEMSQSFFQARSGLLADAYFSASKIEWILQNVKTAAALLANDNLCFGTIDTWIIWQLTKGRVHATDPTNAARTLLYNIHENNWDEKLCEIFHVPSRLLPKVYDCAFEYGSSDPDIFGKAIPITGVIGDQQAALFGQACFTKGMVKSTYGTGCFVVLNTGDKAVPSTHQLLTTIGYRMHGKTTYALEGSIFNAGTAIGWLKDNLQVINTASETEQLASSLNSNGGVYFVPAFTGLGAPYWQPNARAAIMGLTRDTQIAHIVRAALEAVCYQTKDLLQAMRLDLAGDIHTLRVDGGMVQNNWLMQFLADVDNVTVERPVINETTAQGAALVAAVGCGAITDFKQCQQYWQLDRQFTPCQQQTIHKKCYEKWQQVISGLLRN